LRSLERVAEKELKRKRKGRQLGVNNRRKKQGLPGTQKPFPQDRSLQTPVKESRKGKPDSLQRLGEQTRWGGSLGGRGG